jgi:hypothetical protein
VKSGASEVPPSSDICEAVTPVGTVSETSSTPTLNEVTSLAAPASVKSGASEVPPSEGEFSIFVKTSYGTFHVEHVRGGNTMISIFVTLGGKIKDKVGAALLPGTVLHFCGKPVYYSEMLAQQEMALVRDYGIYRGATLVMTDSSSQLNGGAPGDDPSAAGAPRASSFRSEKNVAPRATTSYLSGKEYPISIDCDDEVAPRATTSYLSGKDHLISIDCDDEVAPRATTSYLSGKDHLISIDCDDEVVEFNHSSNTALPRHRDGSGPSLAVPLPWGVEKPVEGLMYYQH